MLNGTELFVLPGYKTNQMITTNGTDISSDEPTEVETSTEKEETREEEFPDEDEKEQSDKDEKEQSDKEGDKGKETSEKEGDKEKETSEKEGDKEKETSEKEEDKEKESSEKEEEEKESSEKEEANLRAQISLSFRQVNSFDLKSLSFKFFAFTSQPILDPNFKMQFLIYYLQGTTRFKSPVLATCHIEDIVSKVSTFGISPVSFNCQFPNETDFTSIEISSSESIAGLPSDKNLLNPALVDEAIAEGKLFNASEANTE